jgi:hypothetical protein
VEVLVDPREVGVDSVVWRGGAVLSGLETAQAHQIRFAFLLNVVFYFAKCPNLQLCCTVRIQLLG